MSPCEEVKPRDEFDRHEMFAAGFCIGLALFFVGFYLASFRKWDP